MPLPTDRMKVKIDGWLKARARAMDIGDYRLARSITADLHRLGWRAPLIGAVPMETTALEAPERADLPKRRGRPPKIREEV